MDRISEDSQEDLEMEEQDVPSEHEEESALQSSRSQASSRRGWPYIQEMWTRVISLDKDDLSKPHVH